MRPQHQSSGALRRARRPALWLVLPVVAASVLAVGLASGRADSSELIGGGVSPQPAAFASRDAGSLSHRAFTISGAVDGLYPGHSVPLLLTIHNLRHFAIVVRSISTSVGKPKPGCSAANLRVGTFGGHLHVAANSSAHVSVTATLIHAAPNACQGAVFPLAYSGRGVKR